MERVIEIFARLADWPGYIDISGGTGAAIIIGASVVLGTVMVWILPDPEDHYEFWPVNTGPSQEPKSTAKGTKGTEGTEGKGAGVKDEE